MDFFTNVTQGAVDLARDFPTLDLVDLMAATAGEPLVREDSAVIRAEGE